MIVLKSMKQDPFTLPPSFLNQLQEFTTGFYLVSLNENGEFNTHSYFPTPASAMALLNFLEVESGAMQEGIRAQASARALEEDEEGEDPEGYLD